jgi:hypothetical protein
MELLESIGWIALGFVPTLGSLEIAFRITKRLKIYATRKIMLREEKANLRFRNELI